MGYKVWEKGETQDDFLLCCCLLWRARRVNLSFTEMEKLKYKLKYGLYEKKYIKKTTKFISEFKLKI